MAKYLTLEGLSTFYAGIKAKLTGKVDKVEGKGLSSVDVTEELVDELTNKIETISVQNGENGETTAVTISEEKGVVITVPAKFSELTNDLEGDNQLLNMAFYNENIVTAIAGNMARVVVDELPAVEDADATKIYMLKKEDDSEENNIYEEYVVVTVEDGETTTSTLEKIGDTKIDLSDYAKKEDLQNAINDIEAISDDEIAEILADEDEAGDEGTEEDGE